jgi:thiol:disulfide interchange protein DsbC
MLKRLYLWLPMLALVGSVQASDISDIKEKLAVIMPDVKIDSIEPLANTGMYEAVINGEIIYFSKDARYVFQGDVIELEKRQNVTELKRLELRKQILASVDEADMIIFEPKKTEHTLTVFTDIDCGYCRKLHQQMADYNALGIRIRYMAFPRTGTDSESYDKAVNVWCAKDRRQALTDAMSDKAVKAGSCNAPVKAQYELGRRLGVTGTPALFLESGELLPGYVPPKRLKEILDHQGSADS